jgi:hypothetical protein
MQLTQNNYFSREANNHYYSASQIKSFLDCPARTMAELSGEYTRPYSQALLVGSYVDAYFDGKKEFERFISEHPELFKRDGSLKSEFVKADEMIARAIQDKVFMEYMSGRKQVIKTGMVLGYPFKIKMDVYKKGVRIVDLKTTRDMEPMYKPEHGRVSFAEFWNYPLQMAIYQAVEGNSLPTYLNVITKESPVDLAVIEIPQHHLDAEMEILAEKLPYFDAIKSGIIEPPRCEKCAYCRETKKLTGAISLDDLIEF